MSTNPDERKLLVEPERQTQSQVPFLRLLTMVATVTGASLTFYTLNKQPIPEKHYWLMAIPILIPVALLSLSLWLRKPKYPPLEHNVSGHLKYNISSDLKQNVSNNLEQTEITAKVDAHCFHKHCLGWPKFFFHFRCVRFCWTG